jgi:hypothetical protein
MQGGGFSSIYEADGALEDGGLNAEGTKLVHRVKAISHNHGAPLDCIVFGHQVGLGGRAL